MDTYVEMTVKLGSRKCRSFAPINSHILDDGLNYSYIEHVVNQVAGAIKAEIRKEFE